MKFSKKILTIVIIATATSINTHQLNSASSFNRKTYATITSGALEILASHTTHKKQFFLRLASILTSEPFFNYLESILKKQSLSSLKPSDDLCGHIILSALIYAVMNGIDFCSAGHTCDFYNLTPTARTSFIIKFLGEAHIKELSQFLTKNLAHPLS
jgi:hypothetical protein